MPPHPPQLAWPAPVEWREECNWAGKDIATECMNFVKLLHAYNRTHLLACGTGAFHPTCAFVEVGHRLEVRPGPGRAGGWESGGSWGGTGSHNVPHLPGARAPPGPTRARGRQGQESL